jgi:23S rRNA (cytidine2498-2'-O)-methyltransferase
MEEETVNIENLLIATAHPEFSQVAVAELQRLDKGLSSIEELEPGVILCSVPDAAAFMTRAARQQPVFVRHLAPVQTIVDLTGAARDTGVIATSLAALPAFALLERGIRFSVQSRLTQRDKQYGERAYSSGQLNQALATAIAEETGAIEAIRKPQVVVSILCTMRKAYLGISPVEENLSDWPGGNRHYARLPEQISRAEFKLLEALEVFDLSLPPRGRALDLGAAPGGWTRLLLEAGLQVVAVDPASLDRRLAGREGLEHYRGYAQQYIDEAIKRHSRFAVIVNDMRMDARGAAHLLARAARCLTGDGFVVSVFKLPHATDEINPLTNFREALSILDKSYGIVQARQLFHNRQEVTVLAAQPLSRRA